MAQIEKGIKEGEFPNNQLGRCYRRKQAVDKVTNSRLRNPNNGKLLCDQKM